MAASGCQYRYLVAAVHTATAARCLLCRCPVPSKTFQGTSCNVALGPGWPAATCEHDAGLSPPAASDRPALLLRFLWPGWAERLQFPFHPQQTQGRWGRRCTPPSHAMIAAGRCDAGKPPWGKGQGGPALAEGVPRAITSQGQRLRDAGRRAQNRRSSGLASPARGAKAPTVEGTRRQERERRERRHRRRRSSVGDTSEQLHVDARRRSLSSVPAQCVSRALRSRKGTGEPGDAGGFEQVVPPPRATLSHPTLTHYR